jgi:hypothetical protein
MGMRTRGNDTFVRDIDAIGWALFFVWTGIALLFGIGWSWALIGTAVIILGAQAVLFGKGERIDVFMAALGVVLLFGTIADLFGSPWSIVPAFLIVIGVAMIGDTLRKPAGRQPRRS